MRSSEQMLNLILDVARRDKHLRAVSMNGSRANPLASPDPFQDVDIVFVTGSGAPPYNDHRWIAPFEPIALLQEPDRCDGAWGGIFDASRGYGWLMLLEDGNRIDLSLRSMEAMRAEYGQDSQTIPLLDKDGCLPPIPNASDRSHWVPAPTGAQFASVTNNFWWCLQNVAKAIRRDQLTYAMNMYIQVVHAELEKMMDWYIALPTGFTLSLGMWGKYYKDHLPEKLYESYRKTYSDADYEHLWSAVFTACRLFSSLASQVADRMGFLYAAEEEAAMMQYLHRIHQL